MFCRCFLLQEISRLFLATTQLLATYSSSQSLGNPLSSSVHLGIKPKTTCSNNALGITPPIKQYRIKKIYKLSNS